MFGFFLERIKHIFHKAFFSKQILIRIVDVRLVDNNN